MADRPPDDAEPARPPGALPPPGPEDDFIEGWDDADIDDGGADTEGGVDANGPPEESVDEEVPEVFGGAAAADASAGEGEDDRDEEDAAEDLPPEDDAPAPEDPAAADPVAFLPEDGSETVTDADADADEEAEADADARAPDATAPATPAPEPASEQPAVEPGGGPVAPSEPEAKPGLPAAPGGRAKEALRRQNDAAGEAAARLRRQMLRSGWLRRAGIAAVLLLATVAVLVYLTRRFTGDAEWAVHLGWLAFALPPLAWFLHRSTERNTPGVERLRATVERGLRRRDEPETPAEPDPAAQEAAAREPIGGMLAAGAAALLVLAAAAVPVARPELEQAAVAFSREAVRLEAQAEALAEAGVIPADRVAGVRERVRLAATAPNDRVQATAQREALRQIDDDLRDRALATAEAAAARLRVAETAAALAGAIDPGVRAYRPPPEGTPVDPMNLPPVPTAAERAGPGGLPPGATGTLVAMIDDALAGPAGPANATPLVMPAAVREALQRADAANEPPPAAELREAAALLRDRRNALGQLLQRLDEAGFPAPSARGASAGLGGIEPTALTERLRAAGRADAAAVEAAAARLR